MLEYCYCGKMPDEERCGLMHSWFQTINDPRYDQITKTYQAVDIWSGAYAKIRMALCPLLDIESALPDKGTLMDVGCGAGMLLQWLALGQRNDKRRLIGLEIDSRRVALGMQICDRLAISDRVGLRVETFGDENTEKDLAAVVFVDVLHHMDYHLQKEMILHAYELLESGGMLLIKDVGTSPVIKYLYNYLFDAMTGVTRITQGKIGYYRSQSGWISLLGECGFQSDVVDVRHIDFAPHIMMVGRK